MDRLRLLTIPCSKWHNLNILRALPAKDGDIWGDLAVLRETPWESSIQTISGDTLSHALHGLILPLQNELGTPPDVLGRRMPPESAWCLQKIDKTCAFANKTCRVGHPKFQDCYEAPGFGDNYEGKRVASQVARAWRDGHYVVVVKGDEFSF